MNDLVKNPFKSDNPVAESSSVSVLSEQSRAVAEVQAALTIAQTRPRNQVAAVDRIINAFSRQALAEVSQYQFARGGTKISGPSIRAMEAIAQQWGNISFGWKEVNRSRGVDGVPYSEVHCQAWDMETNTIKPMALIVRHWRDTTSGGYPLRDERDIYEMIANQAQRRVRACLQAVIPVDVTDTAMARASETLKANADTSPNAIKRMLDAFDEFGVTKDQIEVRIQRRLDSIEPVQMVTMSNIYNSLKDGMSAASDWFDAPANERKTEDQPDNGKTGNDKLKNKIRKKAANKKPSKTAPEPAQAEIDEVPAPTFAELEEGISKAQDKDAIDNLVAISGHLPADQKLELLKVAEAAAYKLAEGAS